MHAPSNAMPRRPRLSLPNVPLHLIQRGNNRQACFYAREAYRRYLDCLDEYAAATGCRIPMTECRSATLSASRTK